MDRRQGMARTARDSPDSGAAGEATPGTRKRGRPLTGAVSIHLRVEPDQLAAVDAWREHQPDNLSRPEAVGRLIELGLKGQ